MIPLHELPAVPVYHPPALTPNRFRDQEAAFWRQQRCRMKLDETEVNAASPGAMGQCDSVSTRLLRVRCMKKNPAKAITTALARSRQ
jgi:hypothetical protein